MGAGVVGEAPGVEEEDIRSLVVRVGAVVLDPDLSYYDLLV